jgi:hypothetical protein
VVFNLKTQGNIARVLRGEDVGTRILPSQDGQLANTAFAQPLASAAAAAPSKSPKSRK